MIKQLLFFAAFVLFTAVVYGQGVVVNADGTHSVVVGTIAINPNGTHSVIHGNIAVNPDGSHSIVIPSPNRAAARTPQSLDRPYNWIGFRHKKKSAKKRKASTKDIRRNMKVRGFSLTSPN